MSDKPVNHSKQRVSCADPIPDTVHYIQKAICRFCGDRIYTNEYIEMADGSPFWWHHNNEFYVCNTPGIPLPDTKVKDER